MPINLRQLRRAPPTVNVDGVLKQVTVGNFIKASLDLKSLYETTAKLQNGMVSLQEENRSLREDMKRDAEKDRVEIYKAIKSEVMKLVATAEHIKTIKQGTPGKDSDPKAIAQMVLGAITPPKDGKNADSNAIVKAVLQYIPRHVSDAVSKLPKAKEFTDDDLLHMFTKLSEKKKVKTSHVDGLDQTLSAFRHQLAMGYLHGSGMSESTFIDDETPTGLINGSNKTFTIASTPKAGTLKVYLGGTRQRVGEDYTLSGTTITFILAPQSGSILLVDYRK